MADVYDTRWCRHCESLVAVYLLGDRQFECSSCGAGLHNPPHWEPGDPDA